MHFISTFYVFDKMVVHVGIDPFLGKISTYDDIVKTFNNFNISTISYNYDIEKVFEMFFEITLKINGEELGCACICFLSSYSFSRILAKNFVDCGLDVGFERVQIIDWNSANVYSAISQSNYYPSNFCDIIIKSAFLTAYLWINVNGCINYFGEFDFDKEMLEKIIKDDDYVIFYEKDSNIFSKKVNFQKTKCISYDPFNQSFGALYKARMTGNDPDIVCINVESQIGALLILNVNDVEIIRVEYDEFLPLTKTTVADMSNTDNTLIAVGLYHEKKYVLPSSGKIFVVLEITEDETYFIQYFEISNDEDIEAGYILPKEKQKRKKYPEIFNSYSFPTKIEFSDNLEIYATGIDLGTSRCCAAVNRKNGIETVALDNTGQRLLPSYISFDEETPKCGQVVIDRQRNYANSTVFDVKRILGKNFYEIEIDKSWPFEVIQYKIIMPQSQLQYDTIENLFIKVKTSTKYCFKNPEEISAVLLKHIKSESEKFQGRKLDDVVITVPAAFNKSQKQATFDAAIIAGWKTVEFMPEPVAAAFAYFIDRPIPNNLTLLLFDLGGGTLDVCIFKIKNNNLQIVSRSGDPNLGGRDFDNLLFHYFENNLTENFDIEMNNAKRYKLILKCQSIKQNLSIFDEEFLDLEEIDPSIDGKICITRNKFEEISADLLDKIRDNINTTLDNADYLPFQIEKVLHVGGGCRMPMIKNLLQEIFSSSEQCCHQNPDEVVAIGAAYYSYYLKIKKEEKFENKEKTCSVM